MAIDFLVHEAADGVGVAVIEGLKAGQEASGWVMKEDQTITIKLLSDRPSTESCYLGNPITFS